MILLVIGNVLLWIAAIVTTLFVVVYGLWSPWWKHEMGQHIFWSMLATAMLIDLTIIRLFLADTKIFAWIRLIVFAYYTSTMTWRLWLVIKAQILGMFRRSKHEEHNDVDRSPQQSHNGIR